MAQSKNTIASNHTKRTDICNSTCISLSMSYGLKTFDSTFSQKMKKDCMIWKSWPRLKCADYWKYIHLQLMRVAEKIFLAMIKKLKFVYDLDNLR